MAPAPWEDAGAAPYDNVIGEDPRLTDPEHGDFRPLPGSPAEGYGCQSFPARGVAAIRGAGTPGWPAPEPERAPPGPPAGGREGRRPVPASAGRLRGLGSAGGGRAIEVSGSIAEDTLWDSDTVLVVGDVVVEDGVTLSVAPGVRVAFTGHYGLAVAGRLQAVGTEERLIHFTSADPGSFRVDSTTTGAWRGFDFPWTATTNDSSHLEYCVIEYCKSAGDSSRGGAFTVRSFSELRVANCVLRHNVADYGAAAYCADYAAPVFCGCLMTDNHAFVHGSAVVCHDAYPALINSTIVHNPSHNEEIFDPTAAVHNHISKARVINCILRENDTQYFLGGQILEGKFPYVRFSDIEDGHPGEGNFDADPLFSDEEPHPYSLAGDSPCINAGTPVTAGLGLPAYDLAGTPRVWLARVDVGAYEWAAPGGVGEPGPAVGPTALRVLPNPSAWLATFTFELASPGEVRLTVLDAAGRRVSTLFDGIAGPGLQRIFWDGRGSSGERLESGIYFCRLRCGGVTKRAARLVLLH